jgi:hypothetical protein
MSPTVEASARIVAAARRADRRVGLRRTGFGCTAALHRGLDVAHVGIRWTGPVIPALRPRRTDIARTAGRHDARRIRHRTASRKSLWLGRIGRQCEVRRRLSNGVSRAWNVNGGCCGRPGRENVDDVGFINAVVGDVAANVDVDPRRRYATGISNGGMLAYALACNTGTFAAIGADSATQLDKCVAPHRTSVMHIHGTADPRIRYDGGPGSGVATPDGGPSVPDLNAFWRNVDGCAPHATTTDGAITTSTAGCPDGRSVALITVDGGEHEWPSFATQALWHFFAAH